MLRALWLRGASFACRLPQTHAPRGTTAARFIFTQRTLFGGGTQQAFGRSSLRPAHRSFFSLAAALRVPLRLLVGGGTAVVGFVAYKAYEAKEWMSGVVQQSVAHAAESAGFLRDLLRNATTAKRAKKTHQNSNADAQGNEKPIPAPSSDENDDAADDTEFHGFIRRMIDVRDVLRVAAPTATLALPTIVVVGSQSAGKSSVLEALVGRAFLPKGADMVTRRPLELTLVHTPDASRDYAVFGDAATDAPMFDFAEVQMRLERLNAAVSDAECVSAAPIVLRVHSRHVPDLSLVDLPGYIALSSRHQPPQLRAAIAALCDRYIDGRRNAHNIILAVSAADVDLANSAALKASRVADPDGRRTVGVVTKVDLVEPAQALALVRNDKYPLHLGYVGVVCGGSRSNSNSSPKSQSSKSNALAGDAYFATHADAFADCPEAFGVRALRRRLLSALEAAMLQSLEGVRETVACELDDVRYRFKVLYNDKPVSMEGYVACLANGLTEALKTLAARFSKAHVGDAIRASIAAKLREVLSDAYWETTASASLAGSMSPEAASRLFSAASALTRCGVGKLSTAVIADDLLRELRQICAAPPFAHHTAVMSAVVDSLGASLHARLQTTAEHIENCVKPLKHHAEFTPDEWAVGVARARLLLAEEAAAAERRIAHIRRGFGGTKQLVAAVQALRTQLQTSDAPSEGNVADEAPPVDVQAASDAVSLHHRLQVVQQRLRALDGCGQLESARLFAQERSFWHRARRFVGIASSATSAASVVATSKGAAIDGDAFAPASDTFSAFRPQYEQSPDGRLLVQRDPCQLACPEAFLCVVAEKLAAIAHSFVHYELVQDFASVLAPPAAFATDRFASLSTFSPLMQLFNDRQRLRAFVRENPMLAAHISMQERLQALEAAKEKLFFLEQMRQSLP